MGPKLFSSCVVSTSTNMRILRVIHSLNPAGGGPIQGIQSITPVLDKMGINTEILCLDPSDAPWLRDFLICVHAVGPGLKGYGYTPHLRRWLREHVTRFDAVIIHGLWLYASFGTWAALRSPLSAKHSLPTGRRPPPYFVFPHGMLDPWFQRTRPVKAIRNTIYWKLLEHRVIRDAAAVLFTSEEERRLARISFRPYACHNKVVAYGAAGPCGTPGEKRELFFTKFSELRGKRLVLFLGRLHKKKGIDLLIRAFARVAGEMEDGSSQRGFASPTSGLRPQTSGLSSLPSDLRLVLAGPCVDSCYLEQLRNLSSDLCPPNSVTFAGMLTGDFKWGAFHAADAFILPSHQENFGIAVAEALACGLPVLISNKVNIWREIEQDCAGLVENDDLGGTIRLLERWLALDLASRASMRAAALSCFLSRFEIERAAKNLITLLQRSVTRELKTPLLTVGGRI